MSRRVSSPESPQTPREGTNSLAYALRLLDDMASDDRPPEFPERDPAVAWARSGAMSLTGTAAGTPRLAPSGLPRAADGAMRALTALGGEGPLESIDAPALFSERAAHFGAQRRGRISPGGSCRLMPTRDGWLALNLARADDLRLLNAWFEDSYAPGIRPKSTPAPEEVWQYVGLRVAGTRTDELVERGRMLGLPVASALASGPTPSEWRRIEARGRPVERAPNAPMRVVDLSALWAGPLCTHLLSLAGADVIKVESWQRPDGARRGPAGFFDLMNAGKRSVALAFGSELGRRRLLQLIDSADVVVESARPRALAQIGIDAGECVRSRPGLSWVSITGYGRREPEANWVAFGDDAAVAAGLSWAVADSTGPLFCGDAIADPLTGLHAAVAALGSYRRGGGELIDLSLCDVARFALSAGPACPDGARVESALDGSHELVAGDDRCSIAEPKARVASGVARALGADNQPVFDDLDRAC